MLRSRVVLIGALVAIAAPIAAQAPSPTPEERAALASILQRNWPPAIEFFSGLTKREPSNGRAWLRLGIALQGARRDREALPALERAISLNFNTGTAAYYLSKVHARNREPARAVEYLSQAIAAGALGPQQIVADSDLVLLRSDAGFQAALARADSIRYPCHHQAEYQQFLFWEGDWNVYVGGRLVGTNLVERSNEGCVLTENWDAQGAQVGKSINYYDPALKKWRQIYVWDSGSATEFTGSLEGNQMRFFTTGTTASGAPMLRRMVFTHISADSVSQISDQSTDDGKTWTNTWNSMYVRKKP